MILKEDKRMSKDEQYLDMAKSASKRSTCLRRCYGAVIVKNDRVISTGYAGAPRKFVNCNQIGYCKRQAMNIPAGQRYELCRSVHAEANAIISASGEEMIGATLYLFGRVVDSEEAIPHSECCDMCKRMIINAGIKEVVTYNNNEIQHINVETWIEEDWNQVEELGWKLLSDE